MDAPGPACPTCGTPRGPYDRFCTGCGLDMGAPGELTLPQMTSSGSARAAAPGAIGTRMTAGRPAPVVGPGYAPIARGTATDWSGPTGTQFPSMIPGAGAAVPARAAPAVAGAPEPGLRLWRTLGVANRIIAVGWLAFYSLGTLIAIQTAGKGGQPDAGSYVLAYVLVGLLPVALLWLTYRPLTVGRSGLVRVIVLLEMLVLITISFGLLLVPLIVIYIVMGPRESAS